MRLKKLEIRNIASIEDAVIDFEAKPLCGSNVILITGETGAGKSTILDAICLALYATTPRMNNSEMDGAWQENDTDRLDITDTMQLMRKNTTEAYARLSFLGSDGNAYEAEWSVERKRKNLSRTWSLKNLSHPDASPLVGNGKGGGKDKEIVAAIQAAVGLTFDQFCRTTMLAQGEFTRFLKSGKKEKAAILEKITNTEQYAEIGAKVFELTHHKYEEAMKAVDPAKKEQPLPQDQRTALEDDIQALGKKLESSSTTLAAAQKKETWLSTEKSLLKNLTDAQQSVSQAKKSLEDPELKIVQQEVTDWDRTEDARKHLEAIREAERTITKAKETIRQLQPKYVILLNGQAFLRQEIEKTAEEIKKIDDEIEAEEGQPTPLEDLNQQRDEALALLGNIRVAQSEVKACFDKTKAREETQKKLHELEIEIENTKKLLAELKPRVDIAKTQYEDLDKQYERLNLAVDTLAEKLRANLRIGKRCPICGQPIQSLDAVPHEQELKAIVEEAKKKRDEAKKAFDELNEQQNKYTIWLNQNVPAYNKELKAFNEDQSLQKARKDTLLSLEKCHIQQLDGQTFDTLEATRKKTEDQKASLEKKIERATKREKLQRDLDDLTKNQADVLDTALKQLLEKLPEWKDLASLKAEELPEILAKTQWLSNQVTSALTNKETAVESQQKSRKLLDSFLMEHPEMTEQRLGQLLEIKDQIGERRLLIQRIKEGYDHALGALKTIRKQMEDHQENKPELAEDETMESLQEAIKELQGQQRDLNEQLGSLKQKLTDDDARIAGLAELKKDYEQKKAVFERWNRLDRLIGDAKGERFRLIAQSYILANLVQTANVHMRTLTDRYTLHAVPGQDLIILVEDAYQGGVKRPASTISGGESFLVSLALALALSEIGQRLKVETLFIDEGFGTLSGEPLLNAINTLELLHESNNRQVCAISHREEVKARIPVQIQVNRNTQSSSSTIDIVPHV